PKMLPIECSSPEIRFICETFDDPKSLPHGMNHNQRDEITQRRWGGRPCEPVARKTAHEDARPTNASVYTKRMADHRMATKKSFAFTTRFDTFEPMNHFRRFAKATLLSFVVTLVAAMPLLASPGAEMAD